MTIFKLRPICVFVATKIFVALLCLAMVNEVLGQSPTLPAIGKNITPPTPEVSSLGKFGDIPVGLHTGIAQTSIPIYTIKVKDIEFPISIDYHASGIRVEEIGSSVGLGFALNAGGAISSTVNGYPDLGPGGFVSTADSHPDFLTFNPTPQRETDYIYAKDVTLGDIDSEPDIFHFNFLGRAGKFTFDAQRKIHPIPYQKIEITMPFTIKDEQGNKYYFTNLETMNVTTDGCDQHPESQLNITNDTYRLTRIESAQGVVINLKYKTVRYSYLLSRNQMDYHKTSEYTNNYCNNPPSPINCSRTANVIGSFVSTIEVNDGTTVEFKYSDEFPLVYGGNNETERRDLPGTFALRKILVKHTNRTAPAKEFVLTYNYHVSPGAPSSYTPAAAKYYRMLLKAVEEVGKPAYRFFYNDAVTMPERHSAAQDGWGYYNGAHHNGTLLPKMFNYGTSSYIEGANRDPDSLYAQSLMLDSIVYPTGGATRFKYESNYYKSAEEFEWKTEIKDMAVGVSSFGEEADRHNMVTIPAGAQALTFNMFTQCVDENGNPSDDPGYVCAIYLRNEDTGSQVFFTTTTTAVSMPSARYSMWVENEGCGCNGGLSWREVHSVQVPVDQNKKIVVGGVRIAKIINYPGEYGSAPVVKRFNYNIPGTNKTSTYILYSPKFDYDVHVPYEDLSSPQKHAVCIFKVRTAGSILPLAGIQGNSVGYRYVTEILGERGEFGKSVNEFNVVYDIEGYGIPMTPTTNYDWLRGLPVSKTDFVYDPSDATKRFKEVRQITNEYEIKHHANDFYAFRNGAFDNETNVVGAKIIMTKPEYIDPTIIFLNTMQHFTFPNIKMSPHGIF